MIGPTPLHRNMPILLLQYIGCSLLVRYRILLHNDAGVHLRGIHLVLLRKVSIEVLRRGFRGAYEQFSKLLYALDKLCRDDIPDILQRLVVSPQLAKRTFVQKPIASNGSAP